MDVAKLSALGILYMRQFIASVGGVHLELHVYAMVVVMQDTLSAFLSKDSCSKRFS